MADRPNAPDKGRDEANFKTKIPNSVSVPANLIATVVPPVIALQSIQGGLFAANIPKYFALSAVILALTKTGLMLWQLGEQPLTTKYINEDGHEVDSIWSYKYGLKNIVPPSPLTAKEIIQQTVLAGSFASIPAMWALGRPSPIFNQVVMLGAIYGGVLLGRLVWKYSSGSLYGSMAKMF